MLEENLMMVKMLENNLKAEESLKMATKECYLAHIHLVYNYCIGHWNQMQQERFHVPACKTTVGCPLPCSLCMCLLL